MSQALREKSYQGLFTYEHGGAALRARINGKTSFSLIFMQDSGIKLWERLRLG
jgi:hypothetical protein